MRGHYVRTTLGFVAAGALLAFGSCSDSSPAPTPIPTPGPGVTIVPAVVSLQLGAPESLAPGATAQLTVTALRNDGSSGVLTSGIQWFSSNTRVLRVDSQGVATALVTGESRVSAAANGRNTSNTILVLPNGTFRLAGQIVDDGLPVEGATVTVIGGTGEGLNTRADGGGRYSLYGVAGTIKVHIKQTGYQNLVQDIQVSGHSTHNMTMVPERARDSLAGRYQLTLTATGCSAIASELQRRTYDALLEQQGARLTVTLSGADFIVSGGRGNRFTGTYAVDGRISFTIGEIFYPYYYYWYAPPTPDIVERVTSSSALLINGSSAATHDGRSLISGTLSGIFAVTNRGTSPYWPYSGSCHSSAHRLELRRQ